jgi:hypothetical protein
MSDRAGEGPRPSTAKPSEGAGAGAGAMPATPVVPVVSSNDGPTPLDESAEAPSALVAGVLSKSPPPARWAATRLVPHARSSSTTTAGRMVDVCTMCKGRAGSLSLHLVAAGLPSHLKPHQSAARATVL